MPAGREGAGSEARRVREVGIGGEGKERDTGTPPMTTGSGAEAVFAGAYFEG
jgi:hypothetical protein